MTGDSKPTCPVCGGEHEISDRSYISQSETWTEIRGRIGDLSFRDESNSPQAFAISGPSSVPPSGNLLDGLIQGSKWILDETRVLTFAFYDTLLVSWTPAGKAAVRDALTQWELVANIKFVEVGPSGTVLNNGVDLSFWIDPIFGILSPNSIAMAGFPDPPVNDTNLRSLGIDPALYPTVEGDVFFNFFAPGGISPGGLIHYAALHEIGHALGLKHPHDDGGRAKPTFADLGIQQLDSHFFTVMSYNFSGDLFFGNARTPMVLDIATIQAIYGPNLSTGAGNDVYVAPPTDLGIVATIWDAGGIDVFDASAVTVPVVINVAPGEASGFGNSLIMVALGVEIESAIGGSSHDLVIGSAFRNTLSGGAGNDTLVGGNGDDSIRGGPGLDLARYVEGRSEFTVERIDGELYRITGPNGSDTLEGVELVGFGDTNALSIQSLVPVAGRPLLFLETQQGRVIIETRPDLAPTHVARVVELAGQGFYDGLAFHQVIDVDPGPAARFIAQTGDPLGNGMGGTGIKLNAELSQEAFVRGTVGMARDAGLHSADSQFFIAFAAIPSLDGQYTVWGRVVQGMEFIEQLPQGNPPASPGRIVQMSVLSASLNQGTAATDLLLGAVENDALLGLDSSDTLIAAEGDDYLDGGAGDDFLLGDFPGSGRDSIVGGSGHDSVLALDGDDTVDGGDGDDLLVGGTGNDLILGFAGTDQLFGGASGDTLIGGSGDDVLWGEGGSDRQSGGAGDDRIAFDVDDPLADGGPGVLDVLVVQSNTTAGPLFFDLRVAANQYQSNPSASTVTGFEAIDAASMVTTFGQGIQVIGAPHDGGLGNIVFASQVSDTVIGSSGGDLLLGNGGADSIDGGPGNDSIVANAGNDTVALGDGADFLFYPAGPGDGAVRIADFDPDNDLIGLGARMGFAAGADAWAAIVQVSDDAVLHHRTIAGSSITFAGLRKADLSPDDFAIMT